MESMDQICRRCETWLRYKEQHNGEELLFTDCSGYNDGFCPEHSSESSPDEYPIRTQLREFEPDEGVW